MLESRARTAAKPRRRQAPPSYKEVGLLDEEEEDEEEEEEAETAAAKRRVPATPASRNKRQKVEDAAFDPPPSKKHKKQVQVGVEDLEVRPMPCTVCVTRLVEGRVAACYHPKSAGTCCYECSRLRHRSTCVMPAENLQALVQEWYREVLVFTRANKELPANLHHNGILLIEAIRKSRKEIAAAPASANPVISAPAASAAPLLDPRAPAVVSLEERVAIAQERQAAAVEQLVTMAGIANKTTKATFDETASHGRVLKRMEGILELLLYTNTGVAGGDDDDSED